MRIHASLSAAFDPAADSLGALQRMLQKMLMSRELSVLPLRVMEQPAQPKITARP